MQWIQCPFIPASFLFRKPRPGKRWLPVHTAGQLPMCCSAHRWCIGEGGGATLPGGREKAGRSRDCPGNRRTRGILQNFPYPRKRRRTSTDAQEPKPTDNRALFPYGPAAEIQPLPETQIARSVIESVLHPEVRIPVQAEVLYPTPWRDTEQIYNTSCIDFTNASPTGPIVALLPEFCQISWIQSEKQPILQMIFHSSSVTG